MPVEFRGGKWRRYNLTALALAAFAAPGNAAGDPGVDAVQHEYKLYNPLFDAIFNGEKHVRKKAGTMLVDGNCAGAKQYVLGKGRFDVASAIDQQCRAEFSRLSLSMFPASRRVYLPPRASAERAQPSLVAPVVINDYSVPIRR